jgi:type I restriction enzyme M protein
MCSRASTSTARSASARSTTTPWRTSSRIGEEREARKHFIEQALSGQDLLTSFQVRGALAKYSEQLKADFKSIAASGWGPELIPDEDILQSQFPDILEDQEQTRTRLAELQALFAAADDDDFEDTDDTGVLPSDEAKAVKATIKAI